jgi:hypothetical protein
MTNQTPHFTASVIVPILQRHWHNAGIVLLLLSLIAPVTVSAESITIQAAAKPGQEWKPMPTQTLDTFEAVGKLSPDTGLSKYGGMLARKEKATGFFHTAKVEGRWWLVDPEGCLFLEKGVNSVATIPTPGAQAALQKKFGSTDNWASDTTKMIRKLGFNSSGAWSDTNTLRAVAEPLVHTPICNFMIAYGEKRGGTHWVSGHMGYPKDCIFVFDPAFEKFCDEYARQFEAQKNDPWLLGRFSDNEMPLTRKSLANYLSLPDGDPGHEAAIDFLRARHGTNAAVSDITDQDKKDFVAVVVDRYFRIVSAALKKHDPNHLFLGCRFHGGDLACSEIFKAAGPYADIISVNYYRVWTPVQSEIAGWEREAGKPILVTEWYAKGVDSGLPNKSGAGWLVKTQKDRGQFYQNFTLGLMQSKVCVGWHWFKYIDNDPDDKTTDPSNTDSNKGLVNNRYEPYKPLQGAMKSLNERSYGIVSYFDKNTK